MNLRHCLRQLECFIHGHITAPTGRHAWLLYEVSCSHCYRRFIANPQYPGLLLPPDQHSDRFMADCAEWERER